MKGVKFTDKLGISRDGEREKLPGTDIVIVYTSPKKWASVKRGAFLGKVAFVVSFATLGVVLLQGLTMSH